MSELWENLYRRLAMEPTELRRRHQEITDRHRANRTLFDLVVAHELSPCVETRRAVEQQLKLSKAKIGDKTALVQRAKEYAQKKRRR
jgi:hypothetical protein